MPQTNEIQTLAEYHNVKRYLRLHRPLLLEREIKQIEAKLESFEENYYFWGGANMLEESNVG